MHFLRTKILRRPRPRRQERTAGRPWAVTANAFLLLLEAGGFLGGAAYYLGPLGQQAALLSALPEADFLALLRGVLFALMAFMALAAAVGLLRLNPSAWVSAVLVQAVELGLALYLYFRYHPPYVYLMMVYGIFMVLYLHQADVQNALRARLEAPPESPPERAEP